MEDFSFNLILSFIHEWWGELLVGLGFIFRDSIINYVATKISNEHTKQLEKLKSNLRVSEKTKHDLSQHLADIYNKRSDLLFSKKSEAAEDLLKARQSLARYQMLTNYMQVFDIPNIVSSKDEKIVPFFRELIKPFDDNLEGLKFDTSKAQLYLNPRAIAAFEIYEQIIISAYLTIKCLSLNLESKEKLLNSDQKIVQLIEEYVPSSKDGFDRFGENYVYYWTQYFYEEIKNALRNELHVSSEMSKNVTEIRKLMCQSYWAAEQIIDKHGNSLNLPINPVFESRNIEKSRTCS